MLEVDGCSWEWSNFVVEPSWLVWDSLTLGWFRSLPPFLLSISLSFVSLNYFSFLFFYPINTSRRWKVTTDSGALISFPPSSRSPTKGGWKEFLIVRLLIHTLALSKLSLSVAECAVRFFSPKHSSPQKKSIGIVARIRAPTETKLSANNSNKQTRVLIPHSYILVRCLLGIYSEYPRHGGAQRLPLRFSHFRLEVSSSIIQRQYKSEFILVYEPRMLAWI